MSSSTSLEEKFDALMRQNEMLMKKIDEDAQRDLLLRLRMSI